MSEAGGRLPEPLDTHRYWQAAGIRPIEALEALGQDVTVATWDDVFEALMMALQSTRRAT